MKAPEGAAASRAEDENADEGAGDVDPDGKDAAPFKRGRVMVRHGQRLARLVITRRPSAVGRAWIRYEESGEEIDVGLDSVVIISVVGA